MNKISLLLITSGILLLSLGACTREEMMDNQSAAGGGELGISPTIAADAAGSGTRANLIDWATEDDSGFITGEHAIASEDAPYNTFGVYGYDKDGKSVTALNPDTFSYSDSKWSGAAKYYWYSDTQLTLVAYYPVSFSGRTSFTPGTDQISFEYTEPGTSAEQRDLMFAYYTGKGQSGVAPVKFTHPLASVAFVTGDVEPDLGKITSVQLSGVLKSGSCIGTRNDTESTYTYAWTAAAETTSVVGTGSSVTTSGTKLGDAFTFLVIPQDLSENNVEFTVTFESGRSMTATATSGAWTAGTTKTYRLDAIFETGLVITDEVENLTKKNVDITNSGEATLYVRATILGNWTDADGNILSQWTPTQGTFTGLPGANWLTETMEGTTVYYYKKPLKPGCSIPDDLFTSYESPECTISGGHLEMEILVQGVLYNDSKSHVTEAWGETIANQLETLE